MNAKVKKLVFGEAPAGSSIRSRRAAYAVLIDERGHIAVVEGAVSRPSQYWLPGGGCQSGESPEAAIEREVAEELGRSIGNVRRIGEAVQIFYAEGEQCWFSMATVFVHAKIGDELGTKPEHEVQWLEPDRACRSFFHASHAWAVRQYAALETGDES